MTTSPMPHRDPVPVPFLAEVATNPAILNRLPLDVLASLRRQVRLIDADVDAAILKQLASHQLRAQEPAAEQLLTPNVAAKRFGVSKRWLLDHADEIPGTMRLSRKTIRFSERRLKRFVDRYTA